MTPSERERRVEAAAKVIFGFASPTRWDTVSDHIQEEYRRRAAKALDAADEAVPMVSEAEVEADAVRLKGTKVVCPGCGRRLGDVIASILRQRGRFKTQRNEARKRAEKADERAEAAARDIAKEAFRGGYERGVSSGSLAPRDFSGLEHHWRTWCHEAGFASFSGEEGTET